jgi:site-specific recombinase XerD
MRSLVPLSQTDGINHIYLTTYQDWLTKQPMSCNTQRVYYSRIKHFLAFLAHAGLNDKLLSNPSTMTDAMHSYLNFLKQTNRQGSTVNANINALNNFFQFLGLQPAPCMRERSQCTIARTLTLNQQERFLQALERQSVRDKALALVLFYTGLRIGDCAKLEMRNIGPGAARIIVGDGIAIILNQETMLALRKWLDERKALVGANLETGLWLTRKGRRLTIAGITCAIERIGWQAGFAISAETLRRTRLTQATESLNKDVLAANFGGYVGKATLKRYAAPFASNFVSGSFNTPKLGHPSF